MGKSEQRKTPHPEAGTPAHPRPGMSLKCNNIVPATGKKLIDNNKDEKGKGPLIGELCPNLNCLSLCIGEGLY